MPTSLTDMRHDGLLRAQENEQNLTADISTTTKEIKKTSSLPLSTMELALCDAVF